MTITVNTPDGGTASFPDGTDPGTITSAMKAKFGGPDTSSNAPAASRPAAMTYDAPDPNAGFWSTVGSKLHNVAVGGNLFNRVFSDSATFGGLDKAQSLIPGSPSVDELRAQTEQSRKDIGPYASTAADVLGYAAGPGELKMGEGVGNLIGRGIVGRVGGSAVEGGVASGLGTAGHGGSLEDTAKATGAGLGIGALTGALPGGSGTRPTTPSTDDLLAAKNAAFAPLKTTPVNAPIVDAAFNSVMPRSGANVNLSGDFKNKVADIQKEVTGTTSGLTAEDIADYQRALWNKTRNGFDQKAAGEYENALNGAVGPGLAYDIKNANAAHNIYKTSGEIDNWLTNPAAAPGAIASRLAKKPAFYQGSVGDALREIGQGSTPPSLGRQVLNYGVDAATRSAIGAGGAYMFGENPYAGAATGLTSKVLVPHLFSAAGQTPIRNALLAARHLNATGMKVNPGVYTPQWLQGFGALSRQAGYGAGSAGGL